MNMSDVTDILTAESGGIGNYAADDIKGQEISK